MQAPHNIFVTGYQILPIEILKRESCIVTLLFAFSSIFSQPAIMANKDTASASGWQPFKVVEVQYYIGEKEQTVFTIDTSLQNFQVYDPALAANFKYRTVGSIGLAAYPVFFRPETPFGFDLGYHAYDLYKLNRHNIRHYKTPVPFTEFNLMIGRKREQLTSVYHAQTIKNRFGFNFEYNRSAGKGFFRNQECNNNNFAAGFYYKTKNQRYQISPHFIFNNINAQENGGVTDPSILYRDTSLFSQELVRMNLAEARTQMRDREVLLKQELAFGKYVKQKINDTITIQQFVPVFKIYQQSGYLRSKINFFDNAPDSNYYGLFFSPADTLIKKDTLGNYIFLQGISNKAGVLLQFSDKYDSSGIRFKNFLLDLSVEHWYYQLQYSERNAVVQNLNYIGILSNHPTSTKKLIYSFYSAFSIIDYNAGDMLLNGKVGYRLGKAGLIAATAGLQRSEPAWFFSHFSIRGTEWFNQFRKVSHFTIGADYSLSQYHVLLSGRFYNITNLLFSNSQKLPQQYDGNIQAWIIDVSKNFRFKGIGFDNLLRMQWFTGSNLIRMPRLWLRQSVFYERKIFKGALQPRIGIDMIYNSNYYANGYFPLTGQFFLQDKQLLRFYPVFDVFVSFKIKTFRMFLKIDHINQGWQRKQPNYYHFYGYPAVQRAFRIGISWRFYD